MAFPCSSLINPNPWRESSIQRPSVLQLNVRSISNDVFAEKTLNFMGLLDKLWDDTVAGPQPENGLSKLRKYSSFSYRPSSGKGPPDSSLGARSDRELGRSYSSDLSVEPVRVTRSIMIVRPAGSPSAGNGSPPVSPASSPAGSTPPVSPFFGGRDPTRFRRKSASDAYERVEGTGTSIPSPPHEL